MTQQKTEPQIRLIRQAAITSILWAATFIATKNEAFGHPDSPMMRLALILVGIGGFLPVIFLYAKSIRMQDEFSQRIHYIALSIAFAFIAALSYVSDLLSQAGLIPQIPSTGLWALMVFVWFITMIVTPRFYR
jgi:drug/metabolite transporter (DMT)-like permease